jgi:2-polyprenyl-3-methyl-5-hydroxy-6-metoxy-1,4-benzoquinol methylase
VLRQIQKEYSWIFHSHTGLSIPKELSSGQTNYFADNLPPMNDRAIRACDCPRCPLCQREGRWLHRDLPDRLFGAPGLWSIRQCGNLDCGLLWLDPMPLAEDLPLAYQNYFTHHDKPAERTGIVHRLYRLLLSLSGLASQRTKLRTFFLRNTPRGRLLEIGCGNGERLAEFRSMGWEVEGQEVDVTAAARATARGLRVHLEALSNLSLTENSFDVVVMNHVIEHVHEPLALLRECQRVLKVGGQLKILTPNTASLGHRRFGPCWMALDPPRHLHLFSPTTLQQLVSSDGFRDCRVWTTAANAQFHAEGSLAIQRTGRHQFGPSPGLTLGIRSLLFQLRASVTLLTCKNSGEECFLTATK